MFEKHIRQKPGLCHWGKKNPKPQTAQGPPVKAKPRPILLGANESTHLAGKIETEMFAGKQPLLDVERQGPNSNVKKKRKIPLGEDLYFVGGPKNPPKNRTTSSGGRRNPVDDLKLKIQNPSKYRQAWTVNGLLKK